MGGTTMIKKFDEFVNEKAIKYKFNYKTKDSIKKVLLDGYTIQFDSNGDFKMSTLTHADMEKRNKEKKFRPIPRTFQPGPKPEEEPDFYDVEMDGVAFDETIKELKKEGKNIVFEPTKMDDYTNVYIK